MVKVRIDRINVGGNKVFGDKLLRDELQIGLKSAKEIIDSALHGDRPVFEVHGTEKAERIVELLQANGYEVGIIEA